MPRAYTRYSENEDNAIRALVAQNIDFKRFPDIMEKQGFKRRLDTTYRSRSYTLGCNAKDRRIRCNRNELPDDISEFQARVNAAFEAKKKNRPPPKFEEEILDKKNELDIAKMLREFCTSNWKPNQDCRHFEQFNLRSRPEGVIADYLIVEHEAFTSFEIKSDHDGTERLPKQIEAYDALCSECWLVTTARKFPNMKRHIPEHWGVLIATDDGLEISRKAVLYEDESLSKQSFANLAYKKELEEYAVSGRNDIETFVREAVLKRKAARRRYWNAKKGEWTIATARENK